MLSKLINSKPMSVDAAVADLVSSLGRLEMVSETHAMEIERQQVIKSKANEAITKHTEEKTRAIRIAKKLTEIIE